MVGLLEAELVCLTSIIIISLGCNLFEIGSWPQFYTTPQPSIRIIPLPWCSQSILDTPYFAEGLSWTSHWGVSNVASQGTDWAWQGWQLWEWALTRVTIVPLRGSIKWARKESLNMMPLLTVLWYFPEAQSLSLRYAEQNHSAHH